MELVTKELSPKDDDDGLYIDIRRNFVLQDALREGRKKKFTSGKHLKVTFVLSALLVFSLMRTTV